MKIKSIHLENFRNFENIDVSFDDINIIWGENAQGKTNLIEAIYLFTGAKSFRGAKDKELIRFGCEKSSLRLDFSSDIREQSAEIIIKDKRSVSLNGVKKKNSAELSNEIKAVVFSPVHLSMVKDGPRERRRFVDGALCQLKANYRKLLKEYSRGLDQRNALLKDIYRHPELEAMLYIWNQNLAATGAKIIYQRLKYLEALTPYVKNIFSGISSNREELDLKYSFYDGSPDLRELEKKLLKEYENSYSNDVLNRTTSVGPHRDDIEILINGKSARIYGSQGQQRSCVLALKLAEAALLEEMTGVKPIALLDDVMSELDETRQDYILNNIKSSQLFVTCCDKETILRLKEGKTIRIENGEVIN